MTAESEGLLIMHFEVVKSNVVSCNVSQMSSRISWNRPQCQTADKQGEVNATLYPLATLMSLLTPLHSFWLVKQPPCLFLHFHVSTSIVLLLPFPAEYARVRNSALSLQLASTRNAAWPQGGVTKVTGVNCKKKKTFQGKSRIHTYFTSSSPKLHSQPACTDYSWRGDWHFDLACSCTSLPKSN